MILTTIFSTFLSSLVITVFSIPALVRLAEEKHLFDEPNEARKIHKKRIPTLGGIAIFGGLSISWCFFADFSQMKELGVLLTAILILFFTGVKDDIIPLSPYKKLVAQLIAATLLVLKADIRLTSFYGFLWIDEIPFGLSIGISIFTILVITNSFNLLDGINGLAGGIGVITATIFGFLFYQLQSFQWVLLSTALAGALVGFLRCNLRNNARIFMGDTGSLTIGIITSTLAISFIEMHKTTATPLFRDSFATVLAISILIVPLFDTLRLFIKRTLEGRSPFSADRSHIHHYLTGMGLTHVQSSITLYVCNFAIVGIALLLENTYNIVVLLTIIALAGLYTYAAFWAYKRQEHIKLDAQKAIEHKNAKAV